MINTYVSLVDDHVLLRSGLAGVINSIDGFSVLFEADNGKDFINQLKPKSPPDIILLDITMPEMNGYETAEWIRVNLPESKILVLSMMRDEAAVIRMIKCGASGYILKDSKPTVLKEALINVRNNGFYLNELVSPKLLYRINNDKVTGNTPELTERELIYLKHACSEMSHKQISEKMLISPRTVDSYRDALFDKLGVNTRVGLVLYAIKSGLVII